MSRVHTNASEEPAEALVFLAAGSHKGLTTMHGYRECSSGLSGYEGIFYLTMQFLRS